jgi:hypothetical protein
MHGSQLPFRYWFIAIHLLSSTKKTFSALELQRQLGHSTYNPKWAMLHKLRLAMGKRFPIKLQLLLIRALPLDNALSAKCFIHVVSRSVFIFSVIFLSICYLVSVCRALAKTYSFAIFGFRVGWCELQMCMALSVGIFSQFI